MSRSPESFREDILYEFGKVNFLRVGNFLPASIFHYACNKYAPEDCEPYLACIDQLVVDGALEKVDKPMPGYRLTQIGYDIVNQRE